MSIFNFVVPINVNLSLLILRLSSAALLFFGHGLPKLMSALNGNFNFPDPIGLGSTITLILAIIPEIVLTIFVALGFFARAASLLIVIFLLIISVTVHLADPLFHQLLFNLAPEHPVVMKLSKEFTLVYAALFLPIAIAGPGKYSFRSGERI